jgi:hypothetical protein
MGEAGDEEAENPYNARMAKFYKHQTPRGIAMAKMFRRLCNHPKQDANAIVVYFGDYSVVRLAAFQQDHCKDTFTQWQKHHLNRDCTEQGSSCRRLNKTTFVVLRGYAATFFVSGGQHVSLTSTGCVQTTSKPSVPRWNVRKKAR